jgi:predicted house-cleaning NTP pyrophosphatase (Maf/HAM1 superfamily)
MYVARLAGAKAWQQQNKPRAIVIVVADTTVVADGMILGKPVDADQR